LLLLLLVNSCTHVPAQAALYGSHIAVPADAGKDLQASVTDVAGVLQKMTGQTFSVNNEYSDAGILLLKSDAPQASAADRKWLAGKGNEPFVIRSDDGENLTVIANDDKGLIHGLYFYLDQLGIRFYFPNDNWTITPHRQDITLKVNREMAPDFEIRDFFGTGGRGRQSVVHG
jgi:hypothetical protein